jgi:hypothetical protein
VNKVNANKIWKMIQEVGDCLQNKMSNHSKVRNAYAHITQCVKNKFGLSYKFFKKKILFNFVYKSFFFI